LFGFPLETTEISPNKFLRRLSYIASTGDLKPNIAFTPLFSMASSFLFFFVHLPGMTFPFRALTVSDAFFLILPPPVLHLFGPVYLPYGSGPPSPCDLFPPLLATVCHSLFPCETFRSIFLLFFSNFSLFCGLITSRACPLCQFSPLVPILSFQPPS